MKPKVLLTGAHGHHDFVDAVIWLRSHTQLTIEPGLSAAKDRLLSARLIPCCIVVAQAYPAQFRRADIESLSAAAPLARMLALLGSWCEGETRTGNPWPGFLRLYWHQWLAHWSGQNWAANMHHASLWNLPRTASFGEQTVYFARQPVPRPIGRIGVFASDRAATLALCDGLAGDLLHCQPLLEIDGAIGDGFDALLWDGPLSSAGDHELTRLRQTYPGVPLLALSNFPRTDDVMRLRHLGASAVISKPFLLNDLRWQVNELITTNRAARFVA